MDRFFRSVLSIREVKYRHDDDFADRLSRHYSITLLVAIAFIISTSQFVGSPISCWCPAHFTDSHRHYSVTFLVAIAFIISTSSYVGNPISCWCPAHFTDSHRHYTTGLLVAAAFIVSTKQFVGDPIVCWCPAHFTDSHKQYTNNICWISNHYYIPFDHKIPDPVELQRREPAISYYQWVPMLLLGQALVAFTPSMIWRFFNVRAGIDVSSLMDVARVSQRAAYSEMREKTVRYLVNQIDRYLLAQRDYRTGCCVRLKQLVARYCFLVGGKRHGNYLTVAYLFVKFLYTFNAIGQILLLDIFMGGDYHMYGVYVIVRLFRGEDWTLLERFPRVTLCDFKIRHNARLHDYVVQCALTINLFNEKIFLMLWYWWVFVALCTIVSSIQWIIRSLYWPGQVHYVKKKLRAFDANQRTKGTVQKFVQFYLRRDGIFLIRLISMNISDMIASEALRGLWESYGPERRVISENPAKSRRAQGPVAVPAPSAMGTMEVV